MPQLDIQTFFYSFSIIIITFIIISTINLSLINFSVVFNSILNNTEDPTNTDINEKIHYGVSINSILINNNE